MKDTVVNGSLRATDSLLCTTAQFKILMAPDGASSSTYTKGTDGYFLKTSGSQAYWSALPVASNSTAGIVQLNDSYSSTDGTKATTGKALLAALQTLDSTLPSGSAANKTLTALTITDGKMASATFTDISIGAGQISSGELSVVRGGTGKGSWTQWGILYASATTALTNTAAGTAGYLLQGNGSAAPTWSNNYTAAELVWYASSSTSTYYYITIDETITAERWIYGSITGTRGTTGSFIATFTIHTNSSGVIDQVHYYDPTVHITNFRAHKNADNDKVLISLTIGTRYSEMRMRAHVNTWASYVNKATAVTTTAPTVSTTVTGYREQDLYFPAQEIYWGGTWTGSANNVIYTTTDGYRGLHAFSYKDYCFGTSQTFGLPPSAILIETTTNGMASSPTWSTGTSEYYSDARKRAIFAHSNTYLPVANLPAFDYWSRSDGVEFTASGSNGTKHRPNIAVGMGIRITADFTVLLRYFSFNCIETRWLSYWHVSTCKIETYNKANDTWTTVYTGDCNNTDTVRYVEFAANKYVRGNRDTNTNDIRKVRWTLVVKTLGTGNPPDNSRYAPSISQINFYGVGMPTNDGTNSTRFAFEMARHGQPIYVSDYVNGNGTGAAHIPTGSLIIGDNLLNTAANTEKWTNVYIGNSANVNAINTHSQGRIYLYSAATKAHVIVGSSTTTEYTHTFPNSTGWIVTGGNGSSTGAGDSDTPVYLKTDGTLAAITSYDGNAASATRINGNLGAISSNTACNIWVSSTASADGIPKYVSGVYVNASTKTIYATTFNGNATSASYVSGTVGNTGANFWANQGTSERQVGVTSSSSSVGSLYLYANSSAKGLYSSGYKAGGIITISSSSSCVISATSVSGAIWNDYAEYRWVETKEPGYCVTETSTGQMKKTVERLQAGCKIISDTFGMSIGKSKKAQTPLAISGRVLAYPYRDKSKYKLGAAVCSAPNGTIDIMSRREIMMYPERIIGTVSEIPDYDIWYAGEGEEEIQVNGRIWIYVK